MCGVAAVVVANCWYRRSNKAAWVLYNLIDHPSTRSETCVRLLCIECCTSDEPRSLRWFRHICIETFPSPTPEVWLGRVPRITPSGMSVVDTMESTASLTLQLAQS